MIKRNVLRFPALSLLLLAASFMNGQMALGQPKARLGISPDRYNVTLAASGSETQALMIKNLSDKPMTIALSVGNWELDENNRVRELPPEPASLDRWIVINPLRVTIPPGAPQTIRWAIMPRSRPTPGEYRAIIFVEEVLAERSASATASVRMKMRMGIPVYAQVGEPVDAVAVEAVEASASGRGIALTVSNSGNRHARLKGRYGIWRADQFPGRDQALRELAEESRDQEDANQVVVSSINEVVVLPDNRRTIRFEPVLPGPGEYVVQLDASFGDVSITDFVALQSEE